MEHVEPPSAPTAGGQDAAIRATQRGSKPFRGVIVSARLQYLMGGLTLYGLGILLSAGWPRVWEAIVGLVVVTLVHTITHLVNDAEDVETDNQTACPTALTGGSRAIQRGLVTPSTLLRTSFWLAVVVLVLTVLMAVTGHALTAGLFALMLLFGYSYSGRPFTLGRFGLGELTAALVMGVLTPLAGATSAGGFNEVLWAGVWLLFAETIFARLCTAYPDIEADRATRKWTVTALLGRRGSACAFLGIAIAVLAVGFGLWPGIEGSLGRRFSSMVVAFAALINAGLTLTGVPDRRPLVIPLLGFWGFAAGMTLVALSPFLE